MGKVRAEVSEDQHHRRQLIIYTSSRLAKTHPAPLPSSRVCLYPRKASAPDVVRRPQSQYPAPPHRPFDGAEKQYVVSADSSSLAGGCNAFGSGPVPASSSHRALQISKNCQ